MSRPPLSGRAWLDERSIELPLELLLDTLEGMGWVVTEVESGCPMVLVPDSGVRRSQIVSILSPPEWTWDRVEKESAMVGYVAAVTRKMICESLSAIPEVAGVYSSWEADLLKLWVLVDQTSFDLNLLVAQALNGVWRKAGYVPHTLKITGNPLELGESARPDYRRK